MNVALIDMGSNSIRLAVYKVEQKDFEPIFSKRYMTGLASYVKEKQLTAAGVEQACIVLLDAKSLLEQLSVDQTSNTVAFCSCSAICTASFSIAVKPFP